MRITADAAHIVSRYAGVLSGGYVHEVGSGDGARIFDRESQTVWFGRPREACAYYLGQIDAYANARGMTLFDCPAEVAAIRAEVFDMANATVRQWRATGEQDARSRVERYCPEIRGAGKP